MKKTNLYKLFLCIPELSNVILKNLEIISELNDMDSELFMKTCKNNKDIINEDIFEELVQIYYKISYLNSDECKFEFDKKLNDFLENDYINCYEDLIVILNSISDILIIPVDMLVGFDPDSSDYYILKFIEYYLNLFRNLNTNSSYDEIIEMYDKDIEKLSGIYLNLLCMLGDTEFENDDDFQKNLLTRVDLFSKILSNKKIMLLNNEKYESVARVVSSINNVNKLEKLEKRIVKLQDDLSDDEFKEKMESYTQELNENTIDLIRERLGYDKESNTTKISNENIIKDELKKILCPENSNKIIKL